MAREFPQRAINTVTTNVPGPQYPLYAVGRQMVAYLPFVPLGQGIRIGVAIMSYNGGVSFGVTGDYDTVPDLTASAAPSRPGSAISATVPDGPPAGSEQVGAPTSVQFDPRTRHAESRVPARGAVGYPSKPIEAT